MKLGDSLTPGILKTTSAYIDALAEMGIRTIDEFVLHFPRAYEDLSSMTTLSTAPVNKKVTIKGAITALKLVRTRTRKQLVQAKAVKRRSCGSISHT
jgi:RecG-like helicase